MMRKLLLFFVMLCVSVGTWAAPGDPYEIMPSESWNNGAEQAVKIKLNQSGSLSDAIAAIAGDASQIVLFEFDPNFTFSDADITALSSLNYATIDLQKYKGDPFTFTNSNVKYVTLPDSWTKADVKAVGQALSASPTFEAALCQGVNASNEPFLTAYSNKAGSLENAIPHLFWKAADYKIGTSIGDCSKLRVLTAMGNICAKDISRRGVYDAEGHYVINGVADENINPANNAAGVNTEGGQLYAGPNAAGATDGAIKNLHDIFVIDLSGAIIPDAYCADIVPHYSGIQTTNLREIWMPEDPNFKTVPADYLNCSSAVHQICIPGNIEYIRTRAFAGTGTRVNYIWTTGSDTSVRYDNGATFITGAGTENEVRTQKYKTEVGKDITATEHFNPAEEYPIFQAGDDNSFNYGTFTLPAGLKLIERFAFYSSTSVSDVYILNPVAPECHVDGFNSSMYHANNTVKAENIREETDEDGNKIKIITREAYNNGINQPMAMLHYPQETGTPNIQRYTDPTRQYSIATGDRDGNGNMLYFPTQTEFEVAEWEGTYGYVWNAWNIDRTWYNQEVMLGTGQGWYGGDFQSDGGYNQAGQAKANDFYTNNPNPNPTTGTDKTDRSFYDVASNGSQPSGLDYYYNTEWEGSQLYPQAVSTTSNYVYVRDDNGDYVLEMTTTKNGETYSNSLQFREYAGSADDALERYSIKQVVRTDGQGNPVYESCTDGNFVQDYEYVEDAQGNLIHDAEYVSNDVDGLYVHDYTWDVDNVNGTHYRPFIEVDKVNDPYNEPGKSIWPNHYKFENGQYVKFDADWQYAQYTGKVYGLSDNYIEWSDGAEGFIEGVTDRYSRSFLETYRLYKASTDAGLSRFDYVDNGYVEATSPDDDDKQHYTKNYLGTYRSATAADAGEQRYCIATDNYESDTPITYTKQNDYRGWHQFVLAGYGYNGVVPNEHIRSFISDNDWWTICEPYDLRYSDLVKFFGTDNGIGTPKIPYLSKLMYVIRDVKEGKITLMFSKNLMEYKEVTASDGQVHGTIDDETKWTAAELAADPIILHKGVPYLIKPNLLVDDSGNITGTRKFDVFKTDNYDLYSRLNEAAQLGAAAQANMIYDGEYTVPAYVVGLGAEGAGTENVVADGVKEIKNDDGSVFTYKDSDNGGKLIYGGKEVSYKISSDFTYTFVGSLYKSLMPQYCYFLGWDSSKNCATFWYSAVQDKTGWNWNNETGIICPNFPTSTRISSAASFNDPARWKIADSNGTILSPDDIVMPTSAGAKKYTFDFGATNYFELDEATGVSEMVVKPAFKETKVYDANGVYRGTSLQNLPKGVYIVNGQKYVVK